MDKRVHAALDSLGWPKEWRLKTILHAYLSKAGKWTLKCSEMLLLTLELNSSSVFLCRFSTNCINLIHMAASIRVGLSTPPSRRPRMGVVTNAKINQANYAEKKAKVTYPNNSFYSPFCEISCLSFVVRGMAGWGEPHKHHVSSC